MKDDVLSNDGVKIAKCPIPAGLQPDTYFEEAVSQLEERMQGPPRTRGRTDARGFRLLRRLARR